MKFLPGLLFPFFIVLSPIVRGQLYKTPLLESLPSSQYVIFLDFDGQNVKSQYWNGNVRIQAEPSNATENDIMLTWRVVSEDYSPFNINVTTDSTVFRRAQMGKRVRCIFTPTSAWANVFTSSGVAVQSSFTIAAEDVPCWAFNSVGRVGGEVASHEIGHTLGLAHDGRQRPAQAFEPYFPGHGKWGAIMSGSFSTSMITQWSQGEYANATNLQDDVAIIASPFNGFGYRPDEAGNTPATARDLQFDGRGTINKLNDGIITDRNDVDVYKFSTTGGKVMLFADGAPIVRHAFVDSARISNLDILMKLTDANGNVIASSSNAYTLKASIIQTIAAGTYYISIDGIGRLDPATNGYSDYGSIGQYFLNGTIPVGVNQAPVVWMSFPLNHSSNPGFMLNPSSTAFDADGTITTVDFYNYDTLLVSTEWPFNQVTWNYTTPGMYKIHARAYDDQGAFTDSEPAYYEYVMPEVHILSPADSAVYTLEAVIPLSATARIPRYTILYVDFMDGNNVLFRDPSPPYSYNWFGAAAGKHTVTVKAFSNVANVALGESVDIYVPPAAPSAFTNSTPSPCAGSTNVAYNFPNVAFGYGYTWEYSGTGFSIINGEDTNSILAEFSSLATSGTLSVRSAVNGVTSTPLDLAITVTPLPLSPGIISGNMSPAPGSVGNLYSVEPVVDMLYEWSYSGSDATLTQNGASATLDFSATGQPGTLSVVAKNACGNSMTSTLLINGVAPPAPSCAAETSGAADYLTRTDDVGIREVIFSDMHHSSGTAIEDIANGITVNGYGDFSSDHVASLEPFTDYTISVALSGSYSEHVVVYIDFDNNGITNEDIVTGDYYIPAGSGTYALPSFRTPSFDIPFNTPLRMRIVDVEASEADPEACGSVGYYGEVQDYSVIFHNVFPVANDDEVTINEDNTAIISVAANDTDPDGSLLLATVDLDLTTPFFQPVATTPEGEWVYQMGNNLKFTPNRDFNGTASIQYTVTDNRYKESLPATITVIVNPVNDAPSFIKGTDQVVNENSGPQLINNWATAISAGPVNESSQTLTFDVTNDNNLLFIIQPSINAHGDLSYTPSPNAWGSAVVSIVLKDSGGTSYGGIDAYPTQTFIITVNHANTLPVANNDSGSGDEDHAVMVNVVSNDVAADGVDAATVDLDPATPGIQNHTTHNGSWTVNTDGVISFIPEKDFNGTTSVSYTVNDNLGATSNTASITVIITAVNDPPVVKNVSVTTQENAVISGNVFDPESKIPEGSPLIVNVSVVTGPQHGTIVIAADGAFMYSPELNYSGSDAATVSICDGGIPALCVSKILTIEIIPRHDTAPVAVNDVLIFAADQQGNVDLLANDSDAENNLLASSVDIDPATTGIQQTLSIEGKGMASVDADGILTFIPVDGFSGSFDVPYTVSDAGGNIPNTALVSITVKPGFAADVFVPNGFTPNGDGTNDLLIVEGADKYRVALYIYNRWGSEVYSSDHYQNDWNGAATTQGGAHLPDGTYFYVVEFSGASSGRHSGFIELRR